MESGKNVNIEFGRHDQPMQDMLMTNIVKRRLHDNNLEKTEKAMGQPPQSGLERTERTRAQFERNMDRDFR